jgi:hypothetical protein
MNNSINMNDDRMMSNLNLNFLFLLFKKFIFLNIIKIFLIKKLLSHIQNKNFIYLSFNEKINKIINLLNTI